MDFSQLQISGDVLSFWNEVRSFLTEQLNEEVKEELGRHGTGHSDQFHHALGAKGWIMPGWPLDQGGAGLDPLRQYFLALELRRHDASSVPKETTAIVAEVIRRWGADQLKQDLLPQVTRGDFCICLGYSEPDVGSDLAAVKTRAFRDGDDWVINGSKIYTTGAQHCRFSLLLARTNVEVPKQRGLSTFLVPLDVDGVEVHPIQTLGGERTNTVFYDHVRVPERNRLGPVDAGWQVLSDPLDAEHGIGSSNEHGLDEINGQGASYVEVLRRLFIHALHWATTTQCDDGRRMLDQEPTRIRLARIAVDIEAARSTPGAMGRVIGADILIRGAAELLEMMGPTSLLLQGEDGAVEDGEIEWGHRFAQGTAIYGGTTDIHRNIVAERILGLPRPRPNPTSSQ
jgi:alkylation response protein AidB-like acyl-CoA dehydrogenase